MPFLVIVYQFLYLTGVFLLLDISWSIWHLRIWCQFNAYFWFWILCSHFGIVRWKCLHFRAQAWWRHISESLFSFLVDKQVLIHRPVWWSYRRRSWTPPEVLLATVKFQSLCLVCIWTIYGQVIVLDVVN